MSQTRELRYSQFLALPIKPTIIWGYARVKVHNSNFNPDLFTRNPKLETF
jgi:hypothetical protein